MMSNPSASKPRTARRSTPTSPKSSSAAPDAESATSTRRTPPSPISITESPQSSPTPFQSPTTSKRLLFEKKNDSPHDGFNAKVVILEETLIGYVHNLSPPRRNRGNTMNYCTFVTSHTKHSLRFAVFAQISVCISCISRAHGLAIRAIGSGYPCQKNYRPCARLGLSVRKKLSSVHMASAIRAKKNCVRAHGSGYPCEKKFHPFEQLRLSVRKIMSSVPTARAIPSKQSRISNEPFATWSLGQESRNKPVKNVNNFVQALC